MTAKDQTTNATPSAQAVDAVASTEHLSRRQFIIGAAGLGVGAVVGGGVVAAALPEDVHAIEASGGYILVDTKKCAGCESCMLACSLVHYGKESIALSRMQVKKNSLASFPDDVSQYQCRQCPEPSCVNACPTGAMHCDPETGARMVDEGKCIGCQRCVEACPFTPSRVQWNFEERFAQKCDLCKNTPYWNHEGGPGGDQACVAVCPMKAVKFVTELPVQNDSGYDVNMRNVHYARIGFPADDKAEVPAGVWLATYDPKSLPTMASK